MKIEEIDKKLKDIESRYYKGHKATSVDIADWWSKEDQKEYKRRDYNQTHSNPFDYLFFELDLNIYPSIFYRLSFLPLYFFKFFF